MSDTHAAGDIEKAGLYRAAGCAARKESDVRLYLRCLLAEACVMEHVRGDVDDELIYFVEMQHRLLDSKFAATRWCLEMIVESDRSPTSQIRGWRELAVIHEVYGRYDDALAALHQSLTLCSIHAERPEVKALKVNSLLQLSVTRRLSGDYGGARRAAQDARTSVSCDAPSLTLGLIELREAAVDLIIGNHQKALAGYQLAERLFVDSPNNRDLSRMRQIACLRGLGDLEGAEILARALVDHFETRRDAYRLRQAVLELAEVQLERGALTSVALAVDEGDRLFVGERTMEALRWSTMKARWLLARSLGGETVDLSEALLLIHDVLMTAVSPSRRDLPRALTALHVAAQVVMRMAPSDERGLALAAARAATAAAEGQRAGLGGITDRWTLMATREAVYALSAKLHAIHGLSEDAATVIELGRSERIEELIERRGTPPLQVLSTTGSEQISLHAFYENAASVAQALLEIAPAPALLPLPAATAPVPERMTVITAMVPSDPVEFVHAVYLPDVGWQATLVTASPNASEVIRRVVAHGASALSGVGTGTWESLSAALLPDQLRGPHPCSPVVLSPDPRLWSIPYPALTLQTGCVADKIALVLTPSRRVHQLVRGRKQWTQEVRLRPASSQIDPALPGAQIELAGLKRWPGGHRPKSTLEKAGLLYLSGHAESPESPLASLEAVDFDSLSTTHLPPLVVLNGCWTGAAQAQFGRDPLSLAVGAVIGGAAVVIAGVGPIGSAATALVGRRWLELVARGTEPAEALRQAQVEIRDAHPDAGPLDWAGLVAIG